MSIRAKICGLSTPEAVDAAVAHGASHTGFVFYPPSPRNVMPAAAGALIARLPGHVTPVALVVDADDAAIAAILAQAPVKVIQAHGHETPERVAAIRTRFGLPVMKAVGIASPQDVAIAHTYAGVADLLLLDAKPPKKGLPGEMAWLSTGGLLPARPGKSPGSWLAA